VELAEKKKFPLHFGFSSLILHPLKLFQKKKVKSLVALEK